MFIGKFFDEDWTEVGRFSVILDNDGENIEICEGETELLRFSLIMNFRTGARLVLVGPTDDDVIARWDWNDPACLTGNCPLISYAYYVDLFDVGTGLTPCTGTDSFIAEVPLIWYRTAAIWFLRNKFHWRLSFVGGLFTLQS